MPSREPVLTVKALAGEVPELGSKIDKGQLRHVVGVQAVWDSCPPLTWWEVRAGHQGVEVSEEAPALLRRRL